MRRFLISLILILALAGGLQAQQLLKQSTAATIMFGPFVDKTDGVTLKTDATTITDIDHASTGIFLSKAGGTAAIRHATVTASVADAYGMMKVTLDTTDTNTLGRLDVLFAKAATYLPVHKSFMVVPANVFDSLVSGSDLLDANASQLGGTSQTGRDVGASVLISSGTGTGQLSVTSGKIAATIAAGDLAANGITASVIATDAVGKIAGGVWDEALSGHTTVATAGQRLQPIRTGTAQAGAAGSVTLDASASASNEFYTNALVQITSGTGASQVRTISGYTGSSKVATITPNWTTNPSSDSVFTILPMGLIAGATAPTAAAVADAVWDEARSGHTTGGTFGEGVASVQGNVSGTVSTVTNLTNAPTSGDFTSTMKTSLNAATPALSAAGVDAIWDEASSGHSTSGTFGYILANVATAADISDSVWDEARSGHTTSGSFGEGVASVQGNVTGSVATATAVTTVNGLAANVITAASIASDADAELADAVWDEAMSGHSTAGTGGLYLTNINTKTGYLPSATAGAAGGVFIAGSNAATSITTALTANITGSITGNLSGSVGTVTGRTTANVDQLDGASISTHATGMFPADVRDIVGAGVSTSTAQLGVNAVNVGGTAAASATIGTATNVTTVNGLANDVITAASIASGADGEIADAVWDEALSGHSTAGTSGKALTDASAATNPWDLLVADYTITGSFGKLIGTDLDATVSSRAPATTAPDNKIVTDSSGRVQVQSGTGTGQISLASGKPAVTLAYGDVTGYLPANTAQVDGASLATHTAGYFPGDLRYIAGSPLSTSTAQLGVNAVQLGGTVPASATVGTVTNLTNTPTTGDFTATQKTSITTAATSATPTVTVAVGTGTGQINLSSGKVPATVAAADFARTWRKNQAYTNYEFKLVLTSDHATAATGKTVTCTRSIDGGAFAACANSATEISNGFYKINLAASDLNGNTVTLRFTATNCDAREVTYILED
jgi:hypothetical protein